MYYIYNMFKFYEYLCVYIRFYIKIIINFLFKNATNFFPHLIFFKLFRIKARQLIISKHFYKVTFIKSSDTMRGNSDTLREIFCIKVFLLIQKLFIDQSNR